MITPYYQDEQVTLHHGDCLDVLRADDYGYDWNLGYRSARMFPDNSVDAVITDPPYGIAFMGKDWDQPGAFGSERRNGSPQRTQREGLAMDAGRYDLSPAAMLNFQRWCTAWATECLRILKPGGHLLAFGGSRTWHRLAAGIEDAGFEIRDSIAWLYGSGFPKSLDVSKAIDKAAGAEREVVGTHHRHGGGSAVSGSMSGLLGTDSELPLTAPATVAAKRWRGWGTALKPSFEPIVVARKPLAGTVAANVLEHGTGALNIDACRIPTGDKLGGGSTTRGQRMKDGWHRPWMDDPDMVAANAERSRASVARSEELGRWPTNVVLDERQAEALDQQTGVLTSGLFTGARTSDKTRSVFGAFKGDPEREVQTYGDSGGASRFFPVFRYEAKAPTSERPNADGVQHPTVKPLDLMRWLVRLVTPVGAVVLEPFAGSGTTAEACVLEDRQCIAIEREADYLPLIVSRLQKPVQAGLFGLEAGA
ncbi:DNA-methyltransferase [Mycobacteroides abscessus]|uniref:DNA-methyltransferase n=1 Tax=Mycobacteroides abscessus TaxID=36809 RepID=UPI0002684075|nr:site-specific DNA-methyltransferase [Mycobacteroides abscessus]EIV32471.1 site-specific DNA-methyltransferase [Mycobacteroides abscessus 3A-0119-R]EIV43670.1 site-specific DNA-methyltransferase [Mycobacteroides abscessus 3A-0731]EIV58087.1 site-specific DNA-methyltransferase [Mycobacteroides abscessus 3A-0930-S]EIV62085.1 site-specific DNA-methyltransferase [Mycobacteroides abscessus 3A-0930-R]EIV84519.1 site-specific DNA-methyltransferase [Mycobacteroides abscessus 3A-0810-R]